MTHHDDDGGYDNWENKAPRRSQRTRFRDQEDMEEKAARRDKRSGKRSHRQKTPKDDDWPDEND